MSKHNRKNNMEPPFDCEFCGVTFDDHDKLNKHKELHRNLPRYKCFKCDYIGKTTNLLKQHMRSHVSRKENILLSLHMNDNRENFNISDEMERNVECRFN